jgi:hypothetical protein
MSLGFCRENFDLNKNSILENKKRDYHVLDVFDGQTITSTMAQHMDYIRPENIPKAGDIVGTQIDLESGIIEYFING